MSWQLGAFTVLALALAAGFAWYERERPDARVVALVGTLAAFAALGRIAFVALPNVKPTTDIVLISGYALGGGPGFAVGALAGLTSNFFFGQGPWTPWQMAGWGATGVLGAVLARGVAIRSHREARRAGSPAPIGRWPLALVCCAAGFAFTAVQDFGDWVTYSDHSRAQVGVYVGKGLVFDAIHAAGCLGFALAFGPALARSIVRFARRLQVRWVRPGSAAVPPIVAALALSVGLALRSPDPARATTSPASYLLAAQNPDGGFGSAPGQPSSQLYTGWAALGLAAAGYDLQRLGNLVGYVRTGAGSTVDAGSLERTILVVRAAGLPVGSFGGHNLASELEGRVRGDGSVSDQVNLTAFAILALRAAGQVPGTRTYGWLERQQNRDGGFGFGQAGGASDTDDTGAVLEALAGVNGGARRARARAVGYLRHQQNRDGGFPAQAGGGSNAQSTAWAVQGLDAAGVSPDSLRRDGSVSPLGYLQGLIAAGGSVDYARGTSQTPVWVTGEALMALEGKPLPLVPVATGSPRARGGNGQRGSRRDRGRRAGAAKRSLTRRGGHRRTGTLAGRAAASRMLGLAADAGLAAAVALAPVGLG